MYCPDDTIIHDQVQYYATSIQSDYVCMGFA